MNAIRGVSVSITNIFDIAGTGMAAQTIRLNTTASNIANADTASSSEDTVYRARKPVFSQLYANAFNGLGDRAFAGLDGQPESVGVQVKGIVESEAPLEMRFQPDHPMANEQGYVMYPNVNIVDEMADMMSASRSFQTNVNVMEAAKTMMQRVLTLGQ